jgi:hypothetical protein
VIQALARTPLEARTVHYPDATLVEAIIGHASLCAGCLERQTGLQARRLHDVLPHLIGSLRVASALGTCGDCRKPAIVHRLEVIA